MKYNKVGHVSFSGPLLKVIFVAVTLIVSGLSMPGASADQFDNQIQALQQQNNQTAGSISQLEQEAANYQDSIQQLQSQIDQIEQQVADSQAQERDLKTQIEVSQQKLTVQKAILGSSIRTLYVDGKVSTLEMLASSKNFSDFVDKQTYRVSVTNKIQDTLKRITKLRAQLMDRQAQVEKLIADQKAQQTALDGQQAEKNKLLSLNTSQQSDYASRVKINQSKIADLRKQQALLIAQYQIGGTSSSNQNHGGYPNAWNNAPKDSLFDSWGMYNRECVSYTAFKVHQDYLSGKNKYDMPYWGGRGNANEWPGDARAAGIPVDTIPTVGSIAISSAGTWGHSMYVESVGTRNGQQAVYVSQYNADFTGHYSEGWRYTNGLVFIHFR